MDAPFKNFEEVLGHLQRSADKPDLEVFEEANVQEALLGILESLRMQEEALHLLQLGIQEAKKVERVWAAYEIWPFIKLIDFDYVSARQTISRLLHKEGVSALLDECENLQRTNSAVQDMLEADILMAWRRKQPRFSSMGTIDSDVQSEHLKDAETLARR